MRFLRLIAPALLVLAVCATLVSAQQGKASAEKGDIIAPYFPTPEKIVDQMLKLGELKAGETVFDLGSGDGRIVIDAARNYKAKAIGVELNDALYKQSMDRIKNLGLTPTAQIIHGDLLKQDYSSADLLTVYLLPVATGLVTPILEKQLKKGARIVAHDFQFASWKAERTVDIDDDGEGRAHELYLYRR